MKPEIDCLSGPSYIGPYRVSHVIGSGGMGVVYRAQHELSGEWVALKKVHAPSDHEIAGLRREVDALRRLNHPGVVRIVDQGVADGQPWYAMELVEGETLASYNARLWGAASRHATEVQITRKYGPRGHDSPLTTSGPTLGAEPSAEVEALVPVAEVACGELQYALSIVRSLCATLSFVHGEGVVHRDLKSANILLCAAGTTKLLDFGLVWRFAGSGGREVLDDVNVATFGTAGYMAPEQIRGELVDARADLYSLGCVLYELLTGALPFPGQSPAEIRNRHLYMPVVPPSALVRGVPSGLDDVVLTMLAKRAEERFGHASEVDRAIALLGGASARGRSASAPRGYVYRSPIVGREHALELLEEQVSRAFDGAGGLVLVSGESGIGKTYLAMSSARDAARRGMSVSTGTCEPIDPSGGQSSKIPLHPFRGLLLSIADRCLAAPELTPSLLGERAKILAVCEPSLATLPGIADSPEPEILAAQATQQRLLAALSDTLAALARLCPSMLLLDDLQWADELTLSFLEGLSDAWFGDKSLLLVCIYRADEETAGLRSLRQTPHRRSITLGRLAPDAIAHLVSGMLAIDAPPPRFVELVADKSEGNPFFIAELLRTAVAEQLLFRTEKGSWSLDRRLLASGAERSSLELPSSLVSLVERRLRGLSGAARQVLSVLSVAGREVELALLLEVTGWTEEDAWQPLRELVARQVLEEVRAVGPTRGEGHGGCFKFLHDKLRETAYRQIPAEERRALHRRTAAALREQYRDFGELPLIYATLAHHHRHGGELSDAIRCFDLAGEHALATYANRDAIAHFADAAELASQASLGEQSVSLVVRARWERRMAEALYALGDLEAVDRHLARALALVGQSPPTSTLGWTLSVLRDVPEQALHRLRGTRAVRATPELRAELAEAALSMHHLAERHYYSSDALPMIGAGLRSVNLAERAGTEGRLPAPYAMLGMAAGISGLSNLGRRYLTIARETARAAGNDPGLVYSLYSHAAWRIGDGAWDEVRALCSEGVAIARRIRDVKALGMAQTLIAHVDFYTGRFHQSVRIYRELEENARRTGDRQHLSWGLYSGARARIALGELEPSLAMLKEATEVLEPLVEVPSKIITPGLLASVYLRLGDMPRALDAADLATARIRRSLPTVFATVAGYAGAAEVYVAHYRQLQQRGQSLQAAHARKVARRAVFDLRVLSLNIGIARPYYFRLRGSFELADGRARAARRSFERGVASACELGMPHDEALLRRELARISPSQATGGDLHELRAQRLLAKLGCSDAPTRAPELRTE